MFTQEKRNNHYYHKLRLLDALPKLRSLEISQTQNSDLKQIYFHYTEIFINFAGKISL